MRKNVFGRRLKRDKNQRKALFKSLMSSLVLEEKIKTTEEKAKAIKGQIEKLVTKVKKKGVLTRNQLQDYLVPKAIDKFMSDTSLRFLKRPGGYTRLVRLGQRIDSSSMVLMEWVEKAVQSSNFKDQNLGQEKENARNIKEKPQKKILKKAEKPVKKVKKESRSKK